MARAKQSLVSSRADSKKGQRRHQEWLRRRDQDAIVAWKKLGTIEGGRERQRMLLHELITTRGEEFRRAYRGVLSLGYGEAKRKGIARGDGPCVIFVVKRKAAKRSKSEHHVPKRLYLYAEIDGQRTLCAAPTDVEDLRQYTGLQRHSGYAFVKCDRGTQKGALTALVRVRLTNGELTPDRLVLSCLHLLGAASWYAPNYPPSIEVRSSDDSACLAVKSDYRGYLADAPTPSLDAAMAKVNEGQIPSLLAILPDKRPTKRIVADWQIPSTFLIHTPRGAIRAENTRVHQEPTFSIPYDADSGWKQYQVCHSVAVESDADTKPGDSGSPVTNETGELLLGMHIAGADGTAVMLPATILFDASRWPGLGPSCAIELDSQP